MSNTHDTEKPEVNPVLANGTFKSPVVWRMLKLMSFSSRYSWRIMKVVTLTSFVTIYYKHDESGGIKPDHQDIPVVEHYMIKEYKNAQLTHVHWYTVSVEWTLETTELWHFKCATFKRTNKSISLTIIFAGNYNIWWFSVQKIDIMSLKPKICGSTVKLV